MQQLMKSVSRRTFLKIFGGSVAAVATPVASLGYIFPDTPAHQLGDKTLAEAVQSLVEAQRKIFGNPGFERQVERTGEELMGLLGDVYNKEQNLMAAAPAVSLYMLLGGSLGVAARAARNLRNNERVQPFLDALKNAIFNEQGTDHADGMIKVSAFGKGRQDWPAICIEGELLAADWAGIDRAVAMNRLHGEAGDALMDAYAEAMGSLPPISKLEPQIAEEDLSWLDEINV